MSYTNKTILAVYQPLLHSGNFMTTTFFDGPVYNEYIGADATASLGDILLNMQNLTDGTIDAFSVMVVLCSKCTTAHLKGFRKPIY